RHGHQHPQLSRLRDAGHRRRCAPRAGSRDHHAAVPAGVRDAAVGGPACRRADDGRCEQHASAAQQARTMKPLSGVDAAFLHLETPETPMHVASVSLFDLPIRYRSDFHAEVKRQLARRLNLAPVLHRKLAPMPLQFANPVWVDDDAVDLDHHVQRVTLPAPGTMTQFDDCVGRLHAELLDRSRPLWRLHVIDGLESGQVGYYFKAHHAALDGQAGIELARTLFDLSPRPPAVPRARAGIAAEHPGVVDLAAAALRHDAGQYIKLVRHLPDVVRTLAGLFGPARAGGS